MNTHDIDIELPPLPESCSDDVARKFSTWQLEAYAREAVRLNAAEQDAEIERLRAERDALAAQKEDDARDVEAVLRLFLTGDGFIAECDIPHIVHALAARKGESNE